jgi:hypothetical protein
VLNVDGLGSLRSPGSGSPLLGRSALAATADATSSLQTPHVVTSPRGSPGKRKLVKRLRFGSVLLFDLDVDDNDRTSPGNR